MMDLKDEQDWPLVREKSYTEPPGSFVFLPPPLTGYIHPLHTYFPCDLDYPSLFGLIQIQSSYTDILLEYMVRIAL